VTSKVSAFLETTKDRIEQATTFLKVVNYWIEEDQETNKSQVQEE